ncbi:MAG: penicillin acylase family protein [Candidatus Hodarchaeales archaeon]|jgi:penicillin amidase
MVIGRILRFALTQLSKRRLPVVDGQLQLPGLKEEVEIIRDKWGIPHIYANNEYDLFFAQGFVQSQDRLWQLEINRRTASGTLSEVFGEIALDTDRTARTFGFERMGRVDYDNASEEVKGVIQAFTDGINAFLDHKKRKLPVEFTLLRHSPNPWSVYDSCAFTRVMLWQLSHAWYGEIVRAKIVEKVGPELAAELEISYPTENPITLPNGIEFNVLNKDGTLTGMKGPFLKKGQGSNGWAISAARSLSGETYLCNDMHLQLMLPSIWYETHLIGAGKINVSGVSLCGVPLIMVGHNERIAWGSTLAFTDAEDLFIEKFNKDNSTQYEFKGEWKEVEILEERILVKGQKNPHIEKVMITHHGPIISDVIEGNNTRLAVNSMALKPTKALQGYFNLNKAINWDDFIEALRLIDATQLNMPYADVDGNIGYWVTGKVPIRANGHDGSIPVPGWTGENEWQGSIPFEEMPHAFNPKEGYIVTCNHKIVPDDYPYFLGNVWMNGYRAKRFVEVINDKNKLSLDDIKKLHLDFTCIPGQEFISLINTVDFMEGIDTDVILAISLLKDWDGILSPNSISGSIYEVLRYHIVRDIFERGLGEALSLEVMGKGPNPVLYHANEFYGHDSTTIMRLLKGGDSWWIREAGGVQKLITRNMKKTIRWLRKNYGEEKNWKWGNLHRVHFPHAMGIQKPLDKVFNRGNLPIGGNTDTLCQTAIHADDPYDVNAWAPSHRQIINMSDLSKSLMIFTPGQSGHLASKHYDDLVPLWHKGDYHPMLWNREEILENSEAQLKLTP